MIKTSRVLTANQAEFKAFALIDQQMEIYGAVTEDFLKKILKSAMAQVDMSPGLTSYCWRELLSRSCYKKVVIYSDSDTPVMAGYSLDSNDPSSKDFYDLRN